MHEASRSMSSPWPTSQPRPMRTRVSGGAPVLTNETLWPFRSDTRPLSRLTMPPAGGGGPAGVGGGGGGPHCCCGCWGGGGPHCCWGCCWGGGGPHCCWGCCWGGGGPHCWGCCEGALPQSGW